MFRFVVLPATQSAVPAAFWATRLITHVLVGAPRCDLLGIGSGGPKRQPTVLHLRKAHDLVHTPPLHCPPLHCVFAVHAPQSASAVHVLPRFGPRMQRLPPASVGVVPVRVRVVPTHDALVVELPWSGTVDGSGTPTAEPPK